MKSDELQKNVFATYFSLRVGMAALAALFPVILWIGGAFRGIELQESMSAYYHAASNGHTMRDWFVGILFAVGAFLYLYKGFSWQENWALNFGGVFALGIALFPMPWKCDIACELISAHAAFASLFFLSIAYVCIFRASDTLHLLEEGQRRKYRVIYKTLGALMVATPVVGALMTVVFMQFKSYVYFAEVAGIWTFAAYWIVKSVELGATRAEHLALQGVLQGR
ncbi:MAG TPA: hypothetical protein VIU46_01620 [Gallionellaceae bacterium]